MIIESLAITDFRNIVQAKLQCSATLNIITGANACGKTSLLEAIYFLSRARSFRTAQAREIIRKGVSRFRLFATVAGQRRVPVGLERSAQDIVARVDGAVIRSLAELAVQVPVLLFDPDSHSLLSGGPQQRRQFMDWGLFHRQASFLPTWKRYRTALRQRNAMLRSGATDRLMDVWDEELCTTAQVLDQLRQDFCQALEKQLTPFVQLTLGKTLATVDYRRGWSQERPLVDILQAGRAQDRDSGYTRAGPHRADFSVRLADHTLPEQLSRGQQKLLVIALIAAQACLYQHSREQSCILHIDDLAAELDAQHRDKIMQCLSGLNTQLFITAIEPGLLSAMTDSAYYHFTLENGIVSKMV